MNEYHDRDYIELNVLTGLVFSTRHPQIWILLLEKLMYFCCMSNKKNLIRMKKKKHPKSWKVFVNYQILTWNKCYTCIAKWNVEFHHFDIYYCSSVSNMGPNQKFGCNKIQIMYFLRSPWFHRLDLVRMDSWIICQNWQQLNLQCHVGSEQTVYDSFAQMVKTELLYIFLVFIQSQLLLFV